MSHAHPKDPLHGLTLEMIVVALVDFYGWEELGRMVVIRCFNHDPSVKSSLTFLRRTPWARAKVEEMYLWMKIEAADRADEARAREVLAAGSGDRAPVGEATNHAFPAPTGRGTCDEPSLPSPNGAPCESPGHRPGFET
jgi:uncharacterized protein (DUF2132 family)